MYHNHKNTLVFFPFFFSDKHFCNLIKVPVERKKALLVYKKLMDRTAQKFVDCPFNKIVFLSDFQEEYDAFSNIKFDKFLKVSSHLFENYQEIFSVTFNDNKKGNVILISGTCFSVEIEEIYNAIDLLKVHDLVFSFAENTNTFRILAIKKYHPDLFIKQEFSSREGLLNWLFHLKNLNFSYSEMDAGFDPENIKHSLDFP